MPCTQSGLGGLVIHYERPDIKLHSISVFPCWNITELWKIAWKLHLMECWLWWKAFLCYLSSEPQSRWKVWYFFLQGREEAPGELYQCASPAQRVWEEKPCQIPILGKLSVALIRLRNVFWPQLHPGCPFLSCRNVFVVGTSRNPIQKFFYSNSSPRNEIVMTFFLLWNRRRYLNVFPIHWK